MTTNYVTSNIAEFGHRELIQLRDLLDAMINHGLPSDFYDDEVRPMFNKYSGNVFLTNSDYQVAMLGGDKLESFYSSPYEGKEGFFDDLLSEFDDMHEEDKEWFRDVAKSIRREDELPALEDDNDTEESE